MKKIFFILLIMITIFSYVQKNAFAKELHIAVSIIPQARFAEEILGDKGKVQCLITEGGSPATYAPSPLALAELSHADIYFTIGVATENNNILNNLPDTVKIVPLDSLVREEYPDLTIGNNRDPHIWLSPKRAIIMVKKMAEYIAMLDVNNKDFYLANAENYIQKIIETDKQAKEILSSIKNKKFMVFHPAFGYLADDYGLEMFALEHHGKEAGAKHLQEMIDIAKKNSIKVIFHQKEISSRQVEAFASEIGGKAVELNPLSYDYTENLLLLAKSIKDAQN